MPGLQRNISGKEKRASPASLAQNHQGTQNGAWAKDFEIGSENQSQENSDGQANLRRSPWLHTFTVVLRPPRIQLGVLALFGRPLESNQHFSRCRRRLGLTKRSKIKGLFNTHYLIKAFLLSLTARQGRVLRNDYLNSLDPSHAFGRLASSGSITAVSVIQTASSGRGGG